MDKQEIYELISEIHEVHLGVADKFLINRMIIERNYTNLDNIFYASKEMLTLMGYESEELTNINRRMKNHERKIAEYMLNRYRKSKQPNNL